MKIIKTQRFEVPLKIEQLRFEAQPFMEACQNTLLEHISQGFLKRCVFNISFFLAAIFGRIHFWRQINIAVFPWFGGGFEVPPKMDAFRQTATVRFFLAHPFLEARKRNGSESIKIHEASSSSFRHEHAHPVTRHGYADVVRLDAAQH